MEAMLPLLNFGPEVGVVRDRRKYATFVKVFFSECKIINFSCAKLTLAFGLVARTNEPLETDMAKFCTAIAHKHSYTLCL
jgi:hypothetical protein